jgi:hypothetical protein
MNTIGKWLYIIGMLVAILAALFGFSHEILTLVLLIAAILAGIFYADPGDAANIGLRYLVLYFVADVFSGEIFGIGDYLTTIFEAAVWFLGPYVLTVLVVRFFNKEFGK